MTANRCFDIERQSKDRLLRLLRASSFAARINVEAVERSLKAADDELSSFTGRFEDPTLTYVVILHEDAPNA